MWCLVFRLSAIYYISFHFNSHTFSDGRPLAPFIDFALKASSLPEGSAMATQRRKSGINVVGDLPWGTHFCHFYETQDDLLDILIPFFKTGLENNEFCLWIVSDPLPQEEATAALSRAVPDLDRRLESGDIEILSHSEWYFCDGAFDLRWTVNNWQDRFASALARGYAGMRVNGNMSWLNETHWQNFAAYEAEVNRILPALQIMVACTYPLPLARGTKVFDVARTHAFAIARLPGIGEMVPDAG